MAASISPNPAPRIEFTRRRARISHFAHIPACSRLPCRLTGWASQPTLQGEPGAADELSAHPVGIVVGLNSGASVVDAVHLRLRILMPLGTKGSGHERRRCADRGGWGSPVSPAPAMVILDGPGTRRLAIERAGGAVLPVAPELSESADPRLRRWSCRDHGSPVASSGLLFRCVGSSHTPNGLGRNVLVVVRLYGSASASHRIALSRRSDGVARTASGKDGGSLGVPSTPP